MAEGRVRVRRVYAEPESDDGARVLVDRIWPRGLTKAKAALDEWCKHVAPSDELRKWYGHDPVRFAEFSRRYRLELQDPTQAEALAHLRGLAKDRQLTLLTATRQPEISEAAVLATLLRSQLVRAAGTDRLGRRRGTSQPAPDILGQHGSWRSGQRRVRWHLESGLT